VSGEGGTETRCLLELGRRGGARKIGDGGKGDAARKIATNTQSLQNKRRGEEEAQSRSKPNSELLGEKPEQKSEMVTTPPQTKAPKLVLPIVREGD